MDIKEIFNFNSLDWPTIIKVAPVAIVAAIPKIRSFFSDYRARTRLRNDIELLKLTSETAIDGSLIKARIDKNMKELYRANKKPLFSTIDNVISGLVWTGGFAWWTVWIYQSNNDFSPWMLITALIGVFGFTMIFKSDRKGADLNGITGKVPVFRITLFSWQTAIINFVLVFGTVWGAISLFLETGVSGWHILMVMVIVGGTFGFTRQFEVKTKSDFNPEDYQ